MSTLTSFSPSPAITTRDVVAANVRAEAARAGFNQVRLGQRLGISQGAIVDLVTPTGRETRLRQDSNLQPRDYITFHIVDKLDATLPQVETVAVA